MLKDSSWYSSKFDSYDKANDSAAIRYLLNSLDEVTRLTSVLLSAVHL
jgi:hypothetical protein